MVSKIFQDVFRVVADGRQFDALPFESWKCVLQLDQLPFAERSPVRGTEKEKNGSFRSFQGVETLYPAKLIADGKGRSLLAHSKPNGHRFEGNQLDRFAIECPADGHGVPQMRGYRCLRFKAVEHTAGVVVQREFCSGNLLGAFGGFIKGFVGIARAGNKNA